MERIDNEQLGRLLKEKRKSLGLSQRDLGIQMYVHESTIKNWENGRIIPQSKMDLVKKFLSTDNITQKEEAPKNERRKKNSGGGTEEMMSLPLIPYDAMAGFLAGNDSSIMEYECEKYVIPVFRGAEFLVRVEGDSMTPSYMSGDIVACRSVPLDRLWFQWGKTYVIHTVQGILIKRMEPSEKNGCVRIESDNPKYKPFDLPVSEINGVALVMGMLRVG